MYGARQGMIPAGCVCLRGWWRGFVDRSALLSTFHLFSNSPVFFFYEACCKLGFLDSTSRYRKAYIASMLCARSTPLGGYETVKMSRVDMQYSSNCF